MDIAHIPSACHAGLLELLPTSLIASLPTGHACAVDYGVPMDNDNKEPIELMPRDIESLFQKIFSTDVQTFMYSLINC